MPVNGLPTILESTINSLLTDSMLTSYKIAGYQERVTLVLRFDSTSAITMADTDAGGTDCSTQGSFRRKPLSQTRRDKTRKDGCNSNVSTGKKERTEILPRQKPSVTSSDCLHVSTCHSASQPVVSKHNNNVTNSETEPDSDVNYFDDDETAAITNPTEKTSPLSPIQESVSDSSLDSSSVMESKNIPSVLGDSGYITHNLYTPLYTLTDSQRYETTECDDYTDQAVTHHRHSTPHQRKDYRMGQPDSDRPYSTKKSTQNKPDDSDLTKLYNDYLQDSENLRMKRSNLKKEVLQEITRSDRNNHIKTKKILLDHSSYNRIVIAETDDLLVEYCASKEKVIAFTAKNNDFHSINDTMRLRQLEQWEDNTCRIEETYPDALDRIKTALPVLKHYIKG